MIRQIRRSSIGRGLLRSAAVLAVALGLSTQFIAPAAADNNFDWQQNHGNGNWHGGNGNGNWHGGNGNQGNWNRGWHGNYGPRFYGQYYNSGRGYYAPPPAYYYPPPPQAYYPAAPYYGPSFSFGLSLPIH